MVYDSDPPCSATHRTKSSRRTQHLQTFMTLPSLVRSDECLGSVEFPVAAIEANGKFNGELPLTRKNGKSGGVLKLTITNIPTTPDRLNLFSPNSPPSFAGSHSFSQQQPDTAEPPLVHKASAPVDTSGTPRARHANDSFVPNVTMCTPRHSAFLSSCMSRDNPFGFDATGGPSPINSADNFNASRACPHCGDRRVFLDEHVVNPFHHPAAAAHLYVRHHHPGGPGASVLRHSTSPLRSLGSHHRHHHHHHHHRRCPCAYPGPPGI
eukprot:Blabericola_migrator_1__8505@NODE_443_length_8422_cov_363_622023_g348_i0_p3_GENE_NODE_443_length_8422_cov_363_622023_g348_i0NODE_443_length_8422_cov_363_622023_g348_i0_p3_ORF_typecomplete_len266_score10_36_NODE_443_length_8422_cov_363_622023_g348_i068147611